MIIFTSVCSNYIHKARCLAQSVKQHMPYARFFVCLTEREVPANARCKEFDEIVLSKDMWPGNFDHFIFKHAIVEASTAVKGEFFRYLLKTYPNETEFVYLDPDCYVYDDMPELREKLKTRPIVLCPHLLKPGNILMELSSTAHGVYNLGFLAVNHSEEAVKFINWWADRLQKYCYDDIPNGIFTDQKWIDLAPCFFDTEIFKHHGYDFATWSLMDAGLSVKDGRYFVEGDPLRFIHYSGYDGNAIDCCMRDWMPADETIFHGLYAAYRELHDRNDADHISQTPWSYSNYTSGEKIDNEVRIAYRNNLERMSTVADPFALSNEEMKKLLTPPPAEVIPLEPLGKRALKVLRDEGIGVFCKKIVNHFAN